MGKRLPKITGLNKEIDEVRRRLGVKKEDIEDDILGFNTTPTITREERARRINEIRGTRKKSDEYYEAYNKEIYLGITNEYYDYIKYCFGIVSKNFTNSKRVKHKQRMASFLRSLVAHSLFQLFPIVNYNLLSIIKNNKINIFKKEQEKILFDFMNKDTLTEKYMNKILSKKIKKKQISVSNPNPKLKKTNHN
jgi:hypothetical protein